MKRMKRYLYLFAFIALISTNFMNTVSAEFYSSNTVETINQTDKNDEMSREASSIANWRGRRWGRGWGWGPRFYAGWGWGYPYWGGGFYW